MLDSNILDKAETTSGRGTASVLPQELQRWNWGAFLLNWIWGIGNNTWLALLCFIPVVGMVMAVALGLKGNEWAWQNKTWPSVAEFKRVQRIWAIAGFSIIGAALLLGVVALATVAKLMSDNMNEIQMEMQQQQEQTKAPAQE